MNIFFLDRNIRKCAAYHCDKHIVKMTLESMQILSTALYINALHNPYKPSHQKHPSVLWAAKSCMNWIYLWYLCAALNDEYKYRYRNQNIKYYNNSDYANGEVNTLHKLSHYDQQTHNQYAMCKSFSISPSYIPLEHHSNISLDTLDSIDTKIHFIEVKYAVYKTVLDSANLSDINHTSTVFNIESCNKNESMLNKSYFVDTNLTNNSLSQFEEILDFTNISYQNQCKLLKYFMQNKQNNHTSFNIALSTYESILQNEEHYNKFLHSFPESEFCDPPQAMPDQYKCINSVEAYRKFYIKEKLKFSQWTKRSVPSFMKIC